MNFTTYLMDEEAHLLAYDALAIDQREHLARELTGTELEHWGFALAPAWQDGHRLHVDIVHTERVLSAEVIRLKTAARIAEIERDRDGRVGKREARDIKQAIADQLIAEAPQRRTTIEVALDPVFGMVLIGTAKAAEAEAILSLFRRELGSFPALPMGTLASGAPSLTLTGALRAALPAPFQYGDRVALALPAGDKPMPKARFTGVSMGDESIKECLRQGYLVERLGLWLDATEFEVDAALVVRRFDLTVMDEDRFDDEMDRWGEQAMRVIRFAEVAKVMRELAVWMEVEQPLAQRQEAA